jgi:hypothetical protein
LVIGTDSIGSKSNYHTTTTTALPTHKYALLLTVL